MKLFLFCVTFRVGGLSILCKGCERPANIKIYIHKEELKMKNLLPLALISFIMLVFSACGTL